MRAGLRALLAGEERGAPDSQQPVGLEIQVVNESASLDDLEGRIAGVDILLVVLEQGGGAMHPAALRREQVRRIAEASPESESRLAVLLLTDNSQAAQALAGLPLSAWGVLPLDAEAGELQAAIQALVAGLVVGAPALLSPLLALQPLQSPIPLSNEDESGLTRPVEALTERENQVLQLLARGLANKQIAAALSISEHTVKFHITSIYTKLGVTNRAEAVRAGIQAGLVLL